MQELLKLQNVSFEFQDQTLFEDINATIRRGEIIGIIGKNGAGKSTLLRLIQGNLKPSNGQLHYPQKNITTFYVKQEVATYHSENVNPLEATLLSKWNVPTTDFNFLSGGERLKARLAEGLSKDVNLLLLDEPTNHLDLKSTELLIKLMKNYKGSIIVVSHNRYFLDKVATKIWSIEDKKLFEQYGNYTDYIQHREQRRRSQQLAFEKQQKMIKRIQSQIHQISNWSQIAHGQSTKQDGYKEYYRVKAKGMDKQVKSKRKRLENELEKAKVEKVSPEYTVKFSIDHHKKLGKRFIEVKHLAKSFGSRTLFRDGNFTIQHGEKIAIIGPNGSGKTTFLKMIMGLETSDGDIWVSPSADIGYLTQEVFDLPLSQTPEQLFYKENFEERSKVQNLMKHLGFTAAQWKEPISKMSMGERVKCKLMSYILEDKDALILDEPTNHLDLPSREQLEETLSEYTGTLLVVSHDLYFLKKITTSKLVFSNKMIQKQLESVSENETKKNSTELRLKLENERQEVLGRLSFLSANDPEYIHLDQKFNELTRQINELK
ncbi:ribosomal protection-like ABC-F family protein [Rummeliibacillus sp. POC4]|uniref:ribosomal protection-like ABC-F family protein n=1 Tax=Rummeliibacillus sp. POC4 TaxID=2305899 RepID=UPI000E669D72|nr:ABC-F type ribosomal protection protein [Rummeliibacillus sp. POC4]RIJ63221.1 ABC transporter ATP-binding protein [Rummeliibacillus sp. POC4]